jgi:hypothetical protein
MSEATTRHEQPHDGMPTRLDGLFADQAEHFITANPSIDPALTTRLLETCDSARQLAEFSSGVNRYEATTGLGSADKSDLYVQFYTDATVDSDQQPESGFGCLLSYDPSTDRDVLVELNEDYTIDVSGFGVDESSLKGILDLYDERKDDMRQEIDNQAAQAAAQEERRFEDLQIARAVNREVYPSEFGALERISVDDRTDVLTRFDDTHHDLVKFLQEVDLIPHFTQRLANELTANYTESFLIGDRSFVLGLIESSSGSHETVLYYTSGSQAVWRWLPGYDANAVPSFSKGELESSYSEQAMTLPAPMQKALSEVASIGHTDIDDDVPVIEDSASLDLASTQEVVVKKIDAKQFLRGLVVSTECDSRAKYIDQFAEPNLDADFDPGFDNQSPESLDITHNFMPDFTHRNDTWTAESPIYGAVSYTTFTSHDGKLEWLFCSTKDNQHWVGGAHALSAPLRPTGIKNQWVNLGVIASPAFEYPDESNHGAPEVVGTEYVDVTESFVHKLPVVRAFIESQTA